jgi:Deoxyribonuclease II
MNRTPEQMQHQRARPIPTLHDLVGACLRFALFVCLVTATAFAAADPPVPLVEQGRPVDWWFVFKFNTASFPQCGGVPQGPRVCPFGGTPKLYAFHNKNYQYSQQFVFASSLTPTLQKGSSCVGETSGDPIGATFGNIYENSYFFVVWNDQFKDHPKIQGCGQGFCGAPWAHSKGLLAWDDTGQGVVIQVSTPSWPGSASHDHPRTFDGNTLGCVVDNDVLVSQHFFALRLTKDDVVTVLQALQNASVVTDPTNPSLVNNGGPADIQALVAALGTLSTSTTFTHETLSTGVELISKPSMLHVPPWQSVSAVLGGVSLRTATWWEQSKIYTTTKSKKMGCWDESLGKPGRVEIATTGQWEGKEIGLTGAAGTNFNHAKIAHTLIDSRHLSIFGDMNQEGAISGNCAPHQNSRGGLFFVVQNEELFNGLTTLLDGNTAPTKAPQ